MSRRFASFCLFLALILLGRAIARFLPGQVPDIPSPVAPNAESVLAMGMRLKLSEVSQRDLQLIPGVSGILSEEIMRERHAILAGAAKMKPEDRHEAMISIHGVGDKTAKKLRQSLSVE